MAIIHVVGPGEHVSQISDKYGFGSFDPIWSDEANAALRDQRKNPHQLVAGDALTIPARKDAEFTVALSKGPHVFVLKLDNLMLRLQVQDIFGDPIANQSGTLSVDSGDIPVNTDDSGKIEIPIPRVVRTGTLQIGGYTLELEIGGLDPPDESSGKWGRFVNLGAWLGLADDSREDPEMLQMATELFQQREGKDPTGNDDSGTLVADLEQAHDVDVA